MAEQLITHNNECHCAGCEAWFKSNACGNGKCPRCSQPVDEHELNRQGGIVRCPAGRA